MKSQAKSNFQRTQSKVWWGNFPDRPYYNDFALVENELLAAKKKSPKTLDKSSSNLWSNRQGSPASHKSQDSGFSDSETSPISSLQQNNLENSRDHDSSKNIHDSRNSPDKLTPNKNVNCQINEHINNNSRSPSICSSSDRTTPPTVIRRIVGRTAIESTYSSRRISFSAPSSPTLSSSSYTNNSLQTAVQNFDLNKKIDELNYSDNTPSETTAHYLKEAFQSEETSAAKCKCGKDRSIKRGRIVTKSPKADRKSLICLNSQNNSSSIDIYPLPNSSLESNSDQTPKSILKSPKGYNNETVILGRVEDSNNNISSQLVNNQTHISTSGNLPTYSELFPANGGTSTPKMNNSFEFFEVPRTSSRNSMQLRLLDTFWSVRSLPEFLPIYNEYENPLLNGHFPSVQNWLDDLRSSYNHEVLSTLQTKSIAIEAARSLKLTSNTAAKIVRHLQTKVMDLQSDFERVEKILASDDLDDYLSQIIPLLDTLAKSVINFMERLRTKNIYHAANENDLKKYEDNIESILEMATDLKLATLRIEDFERENLQDDIQLLKRYVLIAIREVFEKLIKIIISSIEDAKCDLILRSNLSTIAMLSNIDYPGFSSLNAAFLSNEAVHVLLLICFESKHSSIRALALRALATICSSIEAIEQFEQAGGIEILKEIMAADNKNMNRSEPELRETVSVLTQITAPWHGSGHKVDGLKECIESLVENVTGLVQSTNCCQTLLLCAACLNNFSRVEPTSIYSLMSHETLIKLKKSCEKRGPAVSIFLYEQITSMLLNMAINKKCHYHLANKNIISFLTSIFQSHFYEKYESRVENDALKKTIKNVLHIFSRLIHESIVGQEILENNLVPIFSKVERNLENSNEYLKDISFLNKKLNESLNHNKTPTMPMAVSNRTISPNSKSLLSTPSCGRIHESYV